MNDPTIDLAGFIVQILAAIGGTSAVVAIITAKATRRKINTEANKVGADAASVLSTSVIGLIEPMNKQVDVLEMRLANVSNELLKVEKELRLAKAENEALRGEVRGLLVELRQYRRDHPNGV